ncbi:MAG: hypothetical protein Q8K65_01570 [Alphaproteobacteria bacterium]|nr:hypothetical protein [Alphaproteobacteria bacterium]
MAIDDPAPIEEQPSRPTSARAGGLRAMFGMYARPSDSDDIFGEAGFGMEAGLPSEVRRVLQAKMSLRSVPPDAEIKLAAVSAPKAEAQQNTDGPVAFEYGWCYTDHKTGKEIREDFRAVDYLNDEPYATRVHAMLEQLGLPAPRAEEVFRGTHHDLLFLNSHGVVLRIGPLDTEDLINPGILQPLGWLEDSGSKVMSGGVNLPLTVAIYPGVELDRQYDDAEKKPALAGSLYDILTATQQGTGDVDTTGNTGIIRVLDDDGREVAVRLLVDADNRYNGSSVRMREKKSSQMHEQSGSAASDSSAGTAAAPVSKGDVLFNTLCTVFNAVKNVRYWEKAYEAHEPLRHMFWEAFGGVAAVTGLPDIPAREKFWATCAAVTNKPMEITLPVWQMKKDDAGNVSYERQELYVPHLVLYRPWTGQDADRIVQPIKQSKGFCKAVAQAHGRNFGKFKITEDPLARRDDFDARMKDFMRGADKNLGQRLASIGRRVWREIRNF